MCPCNQGCHEKKCKGCHNPQNQNYMLGYVSPCQPLCLPHPHPHPQHPHHYQHSCSDPHPPRPCSKNSCEVKYDIIEYFGIKDKKFNILLNDRCKPMVGFFITFVDCHGYPIHLDDTQSTLQVEEIYSYPDHTRAETYSTYYNIISQTQTKYYYTYVEQCKNNLPPASCLWTLNAKTCQPLKLSFNLSTRYEGQINIYINLFFAHEGVPNNILCPVVEDCIESDECESTGHIRWMVSLCC